MLQIPDMPCCRGFLLAAVLGAVYIWLLSRYGKKNKTLLRILSVSAIAIFLVNCVADFYVISQIADQDTNVFSVLVLAVFHSLELFVFQTHFFDNGYQEYFFGHGEGGGDTFFVYLFSVTFVLACITSAALIIRAVSRRRAGRNWLAKNKHKSGESHVFFSGGDISRTLARSIRAACPNSLPILVGYPDPAEGFVDLSIWERVKRLFVSRPDEDFGPFKAIVYSRVPLCETSGKGLCNQMNLKDLDAYLKDPSCKVYLLSDNEEENLHSTELLYKDGCKAEIFCRACREGVNRMYEDAMTKTPSMNIHLVDSSFLAVRNVKNDEDLLPVNYVDKGLDDKGLREGWVSSAFHAMILGFGETGREALGFLYEHGAFVDKDFRKSPFSCLVMDRMMGSVEQGYRTRFPGMNESVGITFKQCEIGANEFWNEMEGRIQALNYIVICLGNDRLNLRLAVDLVEFAFRKGKDLSRNFVILIAQNNPTHLDEVTLKHYNSIGQYHDCIRTFGNEKDVWTYDNLTGESMKARAKKYFAGYMRAQGDTRDPEAIWNEREKEIVETPDFARHAKRVRQRSQDFADCFHIQTKFKLVGPEILDNRKEIAECIPPSYETASAHYVGTDAHVEKVLHYLAVQEHIRWEASHVALGYTPGKETDEVRKTHACIMDYDDLTPELQHYDYLVVKTTFSS